MGEISVPSHQALRQSGMAEGIAEEKQFVLWQADRKAAAAGSLPSFCPLIVHPGYKPIDWYPGHFIPLIRIHIP